MRVVVVDDHWAVRDGLKWALSKLDDVDVVDDAASAEELLDLLAVEAPDVVLLDIQMPKQSGLEALAIAKAKYPDVRIVMLSMHDEASFVKRAVELGADGYLLKSAGVEEVRRALEAVMAGGVYLYSGVTRALLEDLDPSIASTPRLSPRETEVLRLVADGLENKQIARQLDISETTVKTHLRSSFERLNVASRSEAVATALRLGLID